MSIYVHEIICIVHIHTCKGVHNIATCACAVYVRVMTTPSYIQVHNDKVQSSGNGGVRHRPQTVGGAVGDGSIGRHSPAIGLWLAGEIVGLWG